MPKLIFIFSIFFVYLISCKENLEPLNKNRQYSVNIMYIKDENLLSFEAKDFIDIFNNRMPFFTYQILGYKIKYNLAYGNSLNGFYRENRNIIRKNASLFEDKTLSDITRSSEYWKIIGKETEYYNMIIINIPLNLENQIRN